jgi:hypothetical protein
MFALQRAKKQKKLEDEFEILVADTIMLLIKNGSISTISLQARFRIDPSTARKVLEKLVRLKIVAPLYGFNHSFKTLLNVLEFNQALTILRQIKQGSVSLPLQRTLAHKFILQSGLSDIEMHELFIEFNRP